MQAFREALASIGLDFLPDPDKDERYREQSRAVLALPSDARALALRNLQDSAPVSSLGLRSATLDRALGHGHESVGQLRRLSLAMLCELYGRREAREIYDALMLADRPFSASAPAIGLWRHGLIETEDLPVPTAATTPIEELRPWLGESVNALGRCGIHTLGALRAAASRRSQPAFKEIGRLSIERVSSFLDAYVTPQPYARRNRNRGGPLHG